MPTKSTTRRRATTKSAPRKAAKKASVAGKKAVRGTKRTAKKAATRTTAKRSPAKRSTTSRRAQDAVAVIKADHTAVNALFKRYRAAGKTAYKTKRSLADRIVRELSIHAAVEEQILYPAVRRSVPKGDTLVDEALSEHQQLKETLVVLDKLPAEDERFDRTMRSAIDETRHHVREEESSDGMLARVRKNIDRDELVTMGKMLKAAKKVAPTRPHPHAPSTPPGNLVIGAAAAIVDKARDAVRGR
jgi:hemerythrin superfamily protein